MTFTEQMEAAANAEVGRAIIKAHEKAIHDLEIFHGLKPSVGEGGSGFAYRGFSTVGPAEWKKLVKCTPFLGPLVADGYLMDAAWRKLLAAENEKQDADYYADEAAAPKQAGLFEESG